MKRFLYLSILICVSVHVQAQNVRQLPELVIDAPEGVTPWTSLDFNNNPYHFQFAIVTDRTGGHRPGVFLKGIQKLNLLQPEFVMSVGDLIEGYTEDVDELERQWTQFNGFIDSLDVPFFYLPGNHDITNQVMEDVWEEKFGATYYSFVYGDVLFMCLNSEDQRRGAGRGTISDPQFEWIKKTLAENQEVRWTLVFLHQPLWHQENTERWSEVEELLNGRSHTVFAGHEHRYVQQYRNNGNYITLATTGGGSGLRGAELGEFDHVMWVTMTDAGPMMANLELGGIWESDVINEETKSLIERLNRRNPLQIQPVFIDPSSDFQAGTYEVKLVNDEDVPMHVRFTETFSWDLNGMLDQVEVEVPPNSVETLNLYLRSRRGAVDPVGLRPYKVKAEVSYAFEDAPEMRFPYTYKVRPEVRYSLPKKAMKAIDGHLSDWGKLRYSLTSNEAESDFSASFDLSYDNNYLYVAMEVMDEDVQVMPNVAPWNQDYTAIVISPKPLAASAMDKGVGWYRESLYSLISPETDEVQSNLHQSAGTPEDIIRVCKVIEGGYQMETAIPLTFIEEMQAEDWQSIRVNVWAGDVDGKNAQEIYGFQPAWRDKDNRVGSGTFFREE